jgi:hypothetical protein
MPILSARVNFHKRHSAAQQVARRDAAMRALARIYCDVIESWRSCANKNCKRHRHCDGDAWPCLQRSLPQVPRGLHPRILAQARAGGPRHLAPLNNIERELRELPPGWLK